MDFVLMLQKIRSHIMEKRKQCRHLSELLLFNLVPPDQTPAFEGPAAAVVHQPLLGQQVRLLLGLRALHRFLVPGQTLLLLLLGRAGVFAHLLCEQQGAAREVSIA